MMRLVVPMSMRGGHGRARGAAIFAATWLGVSGVGAGLCGEAALAAEETPGAVAEEEDPLPADRPGATDTSGVVGRLRLQAEVGLEAERFRDDDGVRNDALRTPFELRFGVLDALEVDLLGDGLLLDRAKPPLGGGPSERERGFGDLAGRLRWQVLSHEDEDPAALPQTALFFDLGFPSGTAEERESGVFPAGKVAFDWSLPAAFGLGVNLGVACARDDAGHRFAQAQAAWNLSRSWDPLEPRLASYISMGFAGPSTDRKHVDLILDGGFTFFLTPNLQLDAFAKGGLTPAGPDVGAGVGICIRV